MNEIHCYQTIIELHDSFMEGSDRESATTELDTMKETNFVGRELGVVGAKNGTLRNDDDVDLRLDVKSPSHRRDAPRTEVTGEYQKSVAIFSCPLTASGSANCAPDSTRNFIGEAYAISTRILNDDDRSLWSPKIEFGDRAPSVRALFALGRHVQNTRVRYLNHRDAKASLRRDYFSGNLKIDASLCGDISWTKRGDSRVTHLLLHDDRADVLSANSQRWVSPPLSFALIVIPLFAHFLSSYRRYARRGHKFTQN